MSNTEIAAVNRTFEEAFRKRDFARIASPYTPDAIALPPDSGLVQGRTAIEKFWSSVAEQLGVKEVALHAIGVEVFGDMASEVGEGALTLGTGSATVKYVVVWKRTPDGWRLHRDICNSKAG